MKILVTGRGTSGSWAIRGEQLGAAIGATVQPNASKVKGYDIGVIVKRAPSDLLYRMQAAGLPIVYDVLDGWPQPQGNEWEREACMAWLRGQVAAIRPIAIVAATQAMAHDCMEFGLPVLALPHHARPGQRHNPIRERVQKVGYEGGKYLGHWQTWLESECRARKWEFVLNPSELADLDLIVAMRAARGYAPRRWKSNVKLANAQATGTPCILNREAGYEETKSGGEYFADLPEEVAAGLTELANQETRQLMRSLLINSTLTLERIAAEYKTWLRQRLNS